MSNQAQRAHPKTLPATRWIPQLAVVLIVIGGATLRNLGLPAGWIPELRALCPLGGTHSVASAFNPAVAIEWSRLAIPAGVLMAAVVLGAVFCGRLCPLGSVQEWIGLAGRRILRSRYNRPVPGDRALGLLRYAVLAATIATALGFLAIETDLFNPSLALVHAWTSAVPITAVLLLVTTLVASFFVERPWCRWLCPYGALLGTLARVSPWTIRRDASTCIDCGHCDRACPLAIRVKTVTAVRDSRCNRCERCVHACPVSGALALRRQSAATTDRTTRISSSAGLSPEGISPMMTLRELAQKARLPDEEVRQIPGLPSDFDRKLMLIDIEEEPGLEHMTVGHIRSVFTGKEQ